VPPDPRGRIAILSPGDRLARRNATGDNSRFAELFTALAASGMHVEPAIYHDDFCDEVREQLLQVDGVLVWVNPIEGGRDRAVLDAMLRDVAATGVFVSTHPDVIVKLGTKTVLYDTRELGWGCETRLYSSMEQLTRVLPLQLAAGRPKVLKQNRGNGGNGVWKVQLATSGLGGDERGASADLPHAGTIVRVRHAARGCVEEQIALGDFFQRCAPYFAGSGQMIEQEFQERLSEGMIRCYLVHGTVAGFGSQAVNALFPAPPGASPSEAPQPGPRLYHPPTMPEFQRLRTRLEREWVPAAQRLLGIATVDLPVLWDCDFLLGQKDPEGEDRYVLCEINVSSVAPYPESTVPYVVNATMARVQEARGRRGVAP